MTDHWTDSLDDGELYARLTQHAVTPAEARWMVDHRDYEAHDDIILALDPDTAEDVA